MMISLFLEKTTFWSFLAASGIAAWTMRKIFLHGRITLRFKEWITMYWHIAFDLPFSATNEKQNDVFQKIGSYEKQNLEYPLHFSRAAFGSLFPTAIGSILLQFVYFSSISKAISIGFLAGWLTFNTLGIIVFSIPGAGITWLLFYLKSRSDFQKKHSQQLKRDTRWLDRLFVLVTLGMYLTMYIFPVITSVHAESCDKQKYTTDQLIDCYNPASKHESDR